MITTICGLALAAVNGYLIHVVRKQEKEIRRLYREKIEDYRDRWLNYGK